VNAPDSAEPLRARVAWVQRPHSIRDFFQIAVELETPANVWKGEALPGFSMSFVEPTGGAATSTGETEQNPPEASDATQTNLSDFANIAAKQSTEGGPAPFSSESGAAVLTGQSIGNSPLMRELRAELERQAREAVARAAEENKDERSPYTEESFAKWKAEFEQAQQQARAEFSQQLSAKQDEFLTGLKAEMDAAFHKAHELVSHLNHQTETVRAQSETIQEKSSQVAQSLLQLEVADAALRVKKAEENSREQSVAQENLVSDWRERLRAEMQIARAQWNELLQSSLDSNLSHMIGQISTHSQDILKNAETKMSERLTELRDPFTKAAEDARATISGIQASLDKEVMRARGSLAEVEQVAGRTKEISEQLEAASQDTINQLHQRLEKILEANTAEMNRRADGITENLSQNAALSLDSVGQQFLTRTVAETEGRLAPHLERVPALLRELEARETQTEEGLRVHRERLRQLAENNHRDVESQVAAVTAHLHSDFEAARKNALAKWSEELDASGVRAAHSAAEALERTSEWFQQEARARLQVQVEQSLVTAGAGLGEKASAATQSFETQLSAQSAAHLARIREQVEGMSGEATGRARTELDRAAEAAAASFGQVLREDSERQTLEFRATTSGIQRERFEEFDRTTQELLHKLDVNAWASMESFRTRMSDQLEAAVREGRGALQSEFASTLEDFRAERETHKQQWAQHLDNLTGDATGKFHEKLQATSDAWVASSMRRLNEHGQNGIESLLRNADQALRDSFAKVFEGLSDVLRERGANAAAAGNVQGFGQMTNRESSEGSTPRNNVI
jgi:SOS-response transcriptional repressor LexA